MAEAGSSAPLAAMSAGVRAEVVIADLLGGNPAAATELTRPTEAKLAAMLITAILPVRTCIGRAWHVTDAVAARR
jgi:hypothetical protein